MDTVVGDNVYDYSIDGSYGDYDYDDTLHGIIVTMDHHLVLMITMTSLMVALLWHGLWYFLLLSQL